MSGMEWFHPSFRNGMIPSSWFEERSDPIFCLVGGICVGQNGSILCLVGGIGMRTCLWSPLSIAWCGYHQFTYIHTTPCTHNKTRYSQ
uniref:Uncharacterized protein n=1 Tax=Arundo donax TaxID=35708 RepID=A0A0A9FRK1_ARUDO